jgi:hypothetical protein
MRWSEGATIRPDERRRASDVVRDQRPMLGLRPWFAFFDRILAFLREVRFGIGE